MKTISIIDPADSKDQIRRGTLRMAVEALVANTAEVDRLFATEEFAESFVRKAMERANSIWDDLSIVVKFSTSTDDGITVEEAEFDKKSLEDVVQLFNLIVTKHITIGDKVFFNFRGKTAQGFMSRTKANEATVSVAFVTNDKWGTDEDLYI